jgi:hypothetical protein
MALFDECTPQCAQKELDTADIVRDAIWRQTENKLVESGIEIISKIKNLNLVTSPAANSDDCTVGISTRNS